MAGKENWRDPAGKAKDNIKACVTYMAIGAQMGLKIEGSENKGKGTGKDNYFVIKAVNDGRGRTD